MVSKCCGKEVEYEYSEEMLMYYVCSNCGKPCDLRVHREDKMDVNLRRKAKQLIESDEERRQYPYLDTEGHITVGVGYNLTDRGMPDDWIERQFNDDLIWTYERLSLFDWFKEQPEAIKVALINMCYNIGWKKFLTFKRMIKAFENGDRTQAAIEMLDSKWARQVGARAARLATMVDTGRFLDEMDTHN